MAFYQIQLPRKYIAYAVTNRSLFPPFSKATLKRMPLKTNILKSKRDRSPLFEIGIHQDWLMVRGHPSQRLFPERRGKKILTPIRERKPVQPATNQFFPQVRRGKGSIDHPWIF